MKSTKIGAIFIISVLALAGVGMSYAAWKKDIDIQGSVTTGSVKYQIIEYSCWYVYKRVSDGGIVQSPTPLTDTNLHLVAWSEAHLGTTPWEVQYTFNNLFPCIVFKVDFKVKITGSIPVKINSLTWTFTPAWLNDLQPSDLYWTVTDGAGNIIPAPYTHAFQTDDVFTVTLNIHIPQNDALQAKLDGVGTGHIELIQWNGECGGTLTPKELNLPGFTVNAYYHNWGPSSYWDVLISGIGPQGTGNLDGPYNVWDGHWLGWCCDQDTFIYNDHTYTVDLMSSYDPMNPWLGNHYPALYDWPCVNYILNHKQGTKAQIQDAIWYFIDHGYGGTDTVVWNMINDAFANGQNFIPQTGQNIAVLLIGNPLQQGGLTIQHTFIEVDP